MILHCGEDKTLGPDWLMNGPTGTLEVSIPTSRWVSRWSWFWNNYLGWLGSIRREQILSRLYIRIIRSQFDSFFVYIVGDFFYGCDPMAFITSRPIWGICFWSFWKDHQIKQMVSSKSFSSPWSLGKWILFLTNLFFFCRMGTLQVETHHLSVFLWKGILRWI